MNATEDYRKWVRLMSNAKYLWALLSILAIMVFVLMGSSGQGTYGEVVDEVRARAFLLVDDKGKNVRARLGVDRRGTALLMLNDDRGNLCAMITVKKDGGSRLSLSAGGDEHVAIDLERYGLPTIVLRDSQIGDRVVLRWTNVKEAEGSAYLTGDPELVILDREGKESAAMPTMK